MPAPTLPDRYVACLAHGSTAKGWRGLSDDFRAAAMREESPGKKTALLDRADDCLSRADRVATSGEVWATGDATT